MASRTLSSGTAIVWANSGDYSSTVSGLTRTHQIDLTSKATLTARQGARADLGAARAGQYHCRVGLEYAVAPTTTALAQLYFVFMSNTTGLPAGVSGSDGTYRVGDELEWLRQASVMIPIALTNDATTVIQHIDAGWVTPIDRYVVPVFYNGSLQALVANAIQMYIALIPQTDDFA